ncbi:glutamate--cysteine ligase [Bifidobacterium commune]|uniref:Glutamate--cysteine ligase n=1 Tax=Bifidobacterium commune TaxID=1505727 RepID=A0A1C4GZH1_9BIFI|nr:glutamate-cysteine ligase family protein [Bifidobacterium commune]MBB2955266.1 glutamate--cysteine ligase [Bifidobacterium commune]SCC78046.1 glutamate--cysteine ligase [Bifidobacterium commune]
MNPPRVSYAHLGAKVNDKHLASLLRFFQSGAKPEKDDGYGVEIEHLPVRNGSDRAVSYAEPDGVETLLERLRPYYDTDKEFVEDGHLLGLSRSGISLSLEPGGQFETSIGVLHTPEELLDVYGQFRNEVAPILDELGFRLVNYGYQPVTGFADITLNPKRRYAVMDEYLGHVGSYGPCMMRASASTQVSIDYDGEADAIAKMRVGTALGPIISLFFRNSPYFEGERNPYPLLRQYIWDKTDAQRTGITPGLFDRRFGWEDYARDVLSTPMMFVDLTHTPEAKGLSEDEQEFPAFERNAADIYPDRELNDYEVSHLLSTHFNDVRLKNFVELRHWDSLPIERAELLAETVKSIFYEDDNFARWKSFAEGLNITDVELAKADLQARGMGARPFGRSMEQWQSELGLSDTRPNIPGDPVHPDVFQR